MKTSELQGAALDWAVAECEGYVVEFRYSHHRNESWVVCDMNQDCHPSDNCDEGRWQMFVPSNVWQDGGPIIEREKIGVWWATHYVDEDGVEYGNHWYAEMGCTDENVDSRYCGVADGPTPLVAAMRCYVASKLGDEIELPEELR